MLYKHCLAALFCATALANPASAQSYSAVGYAQVIDANSRVVGPLLSPDGPVKQGFPDPRANVMVKLGQGYFSLQIAQFGFRPDNYLGHESFYKSTDCTGKEYFMTGDAVIPQAFIYPNYVAFPKPPYSVYQFRSKKAAGSAQCVTGHYQGTAGAVGTIGDKNLGFNSPFSVRPAPQP